MYGKKTSWKEIGKWLFYQWDYDFASPEDEAKSFSRIDPEHGVIRDNESISSPEDEAKPFSRIDPEHGVIRDNESISIP